MRMLIGQFQPELKKGKSGDGADAPYKPNGVWSLYSLCSKPLCQTLSKALLMSMSRHADFLFGSNVWPRNNDNRKRQCRPIENNTKGNSTSNAWRFQRPDQKRGNKKTNKGDRLSPLHGRDEIDMGRTTVD
ncbi:hypothetical protein HUJ05_000788 [Dendroctonus ponderosae]|nr:hypothetical protein HUJ05_000788 [Dendroctonus ponderosae]